MNKNQTMKEKIDDWDRARIFEIRKLYLSGKSRKELRARFGADVVKRANLR